MWPPRRRTVPAATVKARFRLRRRAEFDRVVHGERVFVGATVVAFARPNPDGRWRVGVTVSRRLRGAVRRNRVRRRLREAARLRLLQPTDASHSDEDVAYDVVLIGRPAAGELPQGALEEDAARIRRRLTRART